MNKFERAQLVAKYITDKHIPQVYPGISWDALSDENKNALQTIVRYALDYAKTLPLDDTLFKDIPNPLENDYQWP